MRGDMLNMPEMSDLGGEFLDQSLNFTTNLTGDYSQLETAEEAKQYSTGKSNSNKHKQLTVDWAL